MTSQPNPFEGSVDTDWSALIRTRANILVSGDRARLDSFWTTCMREFVEPIERRRADARLDLPRCRTLVLLGIDGLPAASQHRLKAWLDDDANRGTQVVSLTSAPLFAAVLERRFDADLFYRLNTIHVRLGSI